MGRRTERTKVLAREGGFDRSTRTRSYRGSRSDMKPHEQTGLLISLKQPYKVGEDSGFAQAHKNLEVLVKFKL